MCGRYALDTDPEVIQAAFRLGAEFSQTRVPPPRWHIAPTDLAPIVVQRQSGRDLVRERWGSRPTWLREPTRPASINARAETVMTSGLFKATLDAPSRSESPAYPAFPFCQANGSLLSAK